MFIVLSLFGQLLMLFTSVWMLKYWLPKDHKPGWYSAVFCSGLLIASFAASSLLTRITELNLMFWFEQLAFYAAFPLLSFVLLALVFNIDWPKEAWGRILLGACGIYWLCQQTHYLNVLLISSALISSVTLATILLKQQARIDSKQANIAISVSTLASLIIVINQLPDYHAAAELAAEWPVELGLGLLLSAINRGLYLKIKAD